MTLPPRPRKLLLAAHLTASVGWIGALIVYLVLVIAAMAHPEPQTLRAVWPALSLIGWQVIVPLAVASLLSGLILSLGTPWGLFRHYWVVISLILTTLATAILLQHMQTVSGYAALAAQSPAATSPGLPGELLHAGLGLLVLLVVQFLNVLKPRGLTPYGWRKQLKMRSAEEAAPSAGSD